MGVLENHENQGAEAFSGRKGILPNRSLDLESSLSKSKYPVEKNMKQKGGACTLWAARKRFRARSNLGSQSDRNCDAGECNDGIPMHTYPSLNHW